MRNSEESPIFIVGLPRSGTTLMSSLISGHPQITISPETHFLNVWFAKYKHIDINDMEGFNLFWDDYATGEHFTELAIDKDKAYSDLSNLDDRTFKSIFEYCLVEFAKKRNKKRWGEKTPDHYFHIDELFEWYPDSRIIWMLRDPRAVIASRQKVPWGNKGIRYNILRWVRSMDLYDAKIKKFKNIKLVRYESLIEETGEVLNEVCKFLDVEYMQSMIGNRSEDNSPVTSKGSWSKQHLQRAFSPISKDSLDKWKSELTYKQIAHIEFYSRDLLVGNGYELMASKLSTAYLAIFLEEKLRRIYNFTK